jgi:hypothetical protein
VAGVLVAVSATFIVSAGGASAASLPPPPAPAGSDVQSLQLIDNNSGGSLVTVSCWVTSAGGCVAGDELGNLVRYNGTSWAAPVPVFSQADGGVAGVSCAGPTFCMAVDLQGGYSIYTHGTWSRPRELDGPYGEVSLGGYGVSCPTPKFCLVENSTELDTPSAEVRAIGVWRSGTWTFLPTPPSLTTGTSSSPVSCTSPTFCAFVDDAGHATTYKGKSWGAAKLLSDQASTAVSCSSEPERDARIQGRIEVISAEQVCDAVNGDGYAFFGNGSTWAAGDEIDNVSNGGLAGVSCVFELCAAVDGQGNVTYQAISAGGQGTWSPLYAMYDNSQGYGAPAAVSCGDARFCVAVTSAGYAVVLDP